MISLAVFLAIFLGLYAALAGLTWTRRLIAENMGARKRGMMLNLVRRAAPPVCGGLILLIVGSVFKLPEHFPLCALLITGGLAYGFHQGLADVRQGDKRSIATRAFMAADLGLAVMWQGGIF